MQRDDGESRVLTTEDLLLLLKAMSFDDRKEVLHDLVAQDYPGWLEGMRGRAALRGAGEALPPNGVRALSEDIPSVFLPKNAYGEPRLCETFPELQNAVRTLTEHWQAEVRRGPAAPSGSSGGEPAGSGRNRVVLAAIAARQCRYGDLRTYTTDGSRVRWGERHTHCSPEDLMLWQAVDAYLATHDEPDVPQPTTLPDRDGPS